MHFSIRHRRKNQIARIDGPETVARQCGDFWTVIYPGPVRPVEAIPCKFRALAGQPRIVGGRQANAGFVASQPYELIVTDEVVPAAALCRIAVSLHFATKHSRLLGRLSANAYGLYLVHYDFVVWLQNTLLATALVAMIKAAVVSAVR
jgi:hypothetical protein